jgi:hypothetical protein
MQRKHNTYPLQRTTGLEKLMPLFWESYESLNAFCGQNADLVRIKTGGTYIYYYGLKG